VRANDRSAALIAAYTPMPSLPLAFVFDEFRMMIRRRSVTVAPSAP
jgi:hypothetical protein